MHASRPTHPDAKGEFTFDRDLAGQPISKADSDTPAEGVSQFYVVVIAENDALAKEMAEKHLLINYRDEYGGGVWKHPLIGGEDPSPVSEFEAISRDRFLVGSPDRIIQQIQHFQSHVDFDHLICRLYFPGIPHEFIINELRLLAKEVMPAFPQSG